MTDLNHQKRRRQKPRRQKNIRGKKNGLSKPTVNYVSPRHARSIEEGIKRGKWKWKQPYNPESGGKHPSIIYVGRMYY